MRPAALKSKERQAVMERREQKGLEIAATTKIMSKDGVWIVPSQSRGTKYTVSLKPELPHCSCPDYAKRNVKCKHIFAVEYTLQREQSGDAPPPVDKPPRPTYKQEWTAYNAAQVNERPKFLLLLHELCQGIEEPVQERGRPRMRFSDMIFAAVLKTYSMKSGRRFHSELSEAERLEYISHASHFNIVYRYLQSPTLTPYLHQLIAESSMPLRAIETDFAVDSSGFSTNRFARWYNVRWGREIDNRDWVKAHLMCGVKTHIVTSVMISGRDAHDSPFFEPLVEATAASGFSMRQIAADKAYASEDNMRVALRHKARPLIPFKVNVNPEKKSMLWQKLYHFYWYNSRDFEARYHTRSNVESIFSMIKIKFGERVRSKMRSAQENEVLCKVLAHNICVVIQSMFELNIAPDFWQGQLGAGN